MFSIDLNCDVGEGTGNDAKLMPFISSCSIACGGHYGSKQTIEATAQLAQAHGVHIGAHPSYPDSENFGRKSMNLSLADLQDALRKQLDLFFSICTNVSHIKPHGALYNDLFFDLEKTEAVLAVFAEYAPGIRVYCSAASQLAKVAAHSGFSVCIEAFADRSYAKNVIQLVTSKSVECNTGVIIPVKAQTICLHGDGLHVIENAAFLAESLMQNNIRVQGL